MKKPIAVIVNDVHYSLNTLELADAAMRIAINKANSLNIPLIVAGDLHDTKANLRGECMNRMLKTFSKCEEGYILIGNHDRLNEKSEEHSLNFLDIKPVHIIDSNYDLDGILLIPYYHDPEELLTYLKTIPKGSTLIMHQGIQGSNSGEYIQDKSAIRPEDVAGMRVISGHYHARQDIKLPDGGLWTYTGNPYTLNYAETNDPPKGFHILMNDGSLEFIPTNLRKHVVVNIDLNDNVCRWAASNDEDLVWVKVTGAKEQLSKVTKASIAAKICQGNTPFRLDLIPTASNEQNRPITAVTQAELLDDLINQQNASDELKTRLKQLWREM